MSERVIYKYTLAVRDHPEVLSYADAEFLNVQMQNGSLCVWALVDVSKPKEVRTFHIVGTGTRFEPKGKYLGTVQDTNTQHRLVWHVFVEVPK